MTKNGFFLLPTRHIGEVFFVGDGIGDACAVAAGCEIHIARLGRVGGGLQCSQAGTADRGGGQARMKVGVVGDVYACHATANVRPPIAGSP